jgi:hypothetical protein
MADQASISMRLPLTPSADRMPAAVLKFCWVGDRTFAVALAVLADLADDDVAELVVEAVAVFEGATGVKVLLQSQCSTRKCR